MYLVRCPRFAAAIPPPRRNAHRRLYRCPGKKHEPISALYHRTGIHRRDSLCNPVTVATVESNQRQVKQCTFFHYCVLYLFSLFILLLFLFHADSRPLASNSLCNGRPLFYSRSAQRWKGNFLLQIIRTGVSWNLLFTSHGVNWVSTFAVVLKRLEIPREIFSSLLLTCSDQKYAVSCEQIYVIFLRVSERRQYLKSNGEA